MAMLDVVVVRTELGVADDSEVGRMGGAAAADVDAVEVDVERGGQTPPEPQARSVGQHPPPRDAAQVLKPGEQVMPLWEGVDAETVLAVTITAGSVAVGVMVVKTVVVLGWIGEATIVEVVVTGGTEELGGGGGGGTGGGGDPLVRVLVTVTTLLVVVVLEPPPAMHPTP